MSGMISFNWKVAARKVSLEDWLKKLQKNPTVFSSFFVSLFLERISVKGKVAMITGKP